jgi:hypothetical protein
MMVRHKVEDYSKWKDAFDGHKEFRVSNGQVNEQVFRKSENSNEIVALFEWDSVENARKFMEKPELKEAMESAGVVDEPTVVFMDEA